MDGGHLTYRENYNIEIIAAQLACEVEVQKIPSSRMLCISITFTVCFMKQYSKENEIFPLYFQL